MLWGIEQVTIQHFKFIIINDLYDAIPKLVSVETTYTYIIVRVVAFIRLSLFAASFL